MSEPLNSVSELIKSIAEPSMLIGHRFIVHGDEGALRPEEAVCFQGAISKVRRQAGAARIVARQLLSRLNYNDVAITKASSGAPLWPEGIVGSLAHEERVALAAVARKGDFLGLGVDIESAEELPENLVGIIATTAEQSRYGQSFLRGLQLFAAKEAVYKAIFPLDQYFLDFQDIEVELEEQVARVSYGRTAAVKVSEGSHVIALALLRNDRSIALDPSCR
jgi:4'-phosphopantetheinyl transferase EntD